MQKKNQRSTTLAELTKLRRIFIFIVASLSFIFVTTAYSEVIFSDNFDDNNISLEKWETTLDGVFSVGVVEEDGILKAQRIETDNGSYIYSVPIDINNKNIIQITRKVKHHWHNDYYGGSFKFLPVGFEDLGFKVEYAHYSYNTYPFCPAYGFYISRYEGSPFWSTKESSDPIEPIWDEWFDEKIVYNPQTGQVEYYINNEKRMQYNVNTLPDEVSQIKLYFSAWGWWTGHYQYFDDLVITQAPIAPTYSCSGFQSPLANGPVKVKKNRVIPVKAELFNDSQIMTNADILSPPVIQITYQSIPEVEAVDVTEDAYAVGFGTEGNAFEYNATDEVWQFNLQTKNYSAPGTYTITMKSGDETEYLVDTCTAKFVIE